MNYTIAEYARGCCLAAVLLGATVTPALAQSAGEAFVFEIPGVRNYVALTAGVVPDYPGSDNYFVGAAPAGLYKFGDSERYARLLITDVQINVLDSRNWALGPAFNYRFGRDDVNDAAVDRLREIDGTLEAGLFAGWTWFSDNDPRHRFGISAEFLNDVGNSHDGYLVAVGARYFQPVALPLTLSIAGTFTWGDGDYMQTWFGIDADNAARSGLRQFEADSGFRDLRIPVGAVFSLSPNWHVGAGVVYTRYLSDAADSPVTDERGDEDSFFGGVGAAYAW